MRLLADLEWLRLTCRMRHQHLRQFALWMVTPLVTWAVAS